MAKTFPQRIRRAYALAGVVPCLFIGYFFIWPLSQVVLFSFQDAGGSFSLGNYHRFLGDSFYRGLMVNSLLTAIIATAITVVLGYGLALFIATRKQGAATWLFLAVAPMLTGLVIRLYGWIILLSDQGPINQFLAWVGFGGKLDILFSRTAVIIGIVHYCLPFMVLTVYSVLKRIPGFLTEAAATLGAQPWRRFWTVIFPLSMPGIVAGTSLVFALAASTFIVPLMIGGPRDRMLANFTHMAVEQMGDWGFGAAIALTLLVLVVGALGCAQLLARFLEERIS
ncbi:MAG: ABC transporter permease [Limnochordia bacterium]|jgi:ABC-type spermidine/putrescine transport system permease subunit I